MLTGGIIFVVIFAYAEAQYFWIDKKSLSVSDAESPETYYFETSVKVTFNEALDLCTQRQMKLATIHNERDQGEIQRIIKDRGYNEDEFWTSGKNVNGEWRWLSSDEPMQYTRLRPGILPEDTEGIENCLEVCNIEDEGLQWNEIPCVAKKYFICETPRVNAK